MIMILLLLLTGSGQTQASSTPASEPARQSTTDYIVGAQDVLKVTVFGVPELTRDVTVDTDGTFDFPLVGRIKAAGLPVRAVETELKARLSNGFLVNPTVNVDVGAYRSQTVYILGEVREPGRKTLAGNASIMSALAEAGFTTNAGFVRDRLSSTGGRGHGGGSCPSRRQHGGPDPGEQKRSRDGARDEYSPAGWRHNLRAQGRDVFHQRLRPLARLVSD